MKNVKTNILKFQIIAMAYVCAKNVFVVVVFFIYILPLGVAKVRNVEI